MSDIILKVAAKAAIVNNEGKVLILREASTYKDGANIGKWGVPGGRINDDEKFYDGLAREVKEETGLTIEVLYPVQVGEWWPVIGGIRHHIVALFVACRAMSTEITLSDEHDAYSWVSKDDLGEYNIMPPDDEVIKRALHGRSL